MPNLDRSQCTSSCPSPSRKLLGLKPHATSWIYLELGFWIWRVIRGLPASVGLGVVPQTARSRLWALTSAPEEHIRSESYSSCRPMRSSLSLPTLSVPFNSTPSMYPVTYNTQQSLLHLGV